MKGKKLGIAALLMWAAVLGGCVHEPLEYSTKNYVVVEASQTDTLETLAGKYLNDQRKAWVISEFNKIVEVKPGQNIIIPLNPFDLGGLRPDGFQLVPILSYGGPGPSGMSPDGGSLMTIEQQMDYLKKNNYQVIGLSRFMGFLNYNVQIPEKSVVITFNDTTRSVVDEALPVLRKYGFPVTLFVDPQTLGKENALTREDVKQLHDMGVEIQCRGGWDIDAAIEARQISLEQYFDMIRKEIPRAKTILEEITGVPCAYYALPPAGGNNLLIELLKRSGFDAAFATFGDANPFYTDHFQIGRIAVPSVCPSNEFEHKLSVFRNMELN